MTTRAKAIGGLSVVFLLGGVCGALIVGVVLRDRIRDSQQLRDRHGFVEFFERRLELTEAQRDSLRDELMQAYVELADLRSNTTQRFNEVLDSLKQRINPHLTLQQRELLVVEEQKLRRFLPREGMQKHRPQHLGAIPQTSSTPAAKDARPGTDSNRLGALREKGNPKDTQASRMATTSPVNARTDTSVAPSQVPQPERAASLNPSTSPEDVGSLLAGVDEPRGGGGKRAKANQAIREAMKRADLTRDQLAQIVTVMRTTNNEVRTLIANSNDVPAPRLRMMVRSKRREGRKKALALMTPEQRQRFFEYIQSQKAGSTTMPE